MSSSDSEDSLNPQSTVAEIPPIFTELLELCKYDDGYQVTNNISFEQNKNEWRPLHRHLAYVTSMKVHAQ